MAFVQVLSNSSNNLDIHCSQPNMPYYCSPSALYNSNRTKRKIIDTSDLQYIEKKTKII